MKIVTVSVEDRIKKLNPVSDVRRIFIGKYDLLKPILTKKDRSVRWIVLTDVIVYLDEAPVYLDHINLMVKDVSMLKGIKKNELIIGHSYIRHYRRKNGTISCGFNPKELTIEKASTEWHNRYVQIFYDMYYSSN